MCGICLSPLITFTRVLAVVSNDGLSWFNAADLFDPVDYGISTSFFFFHISMKTLCNRFDTTNILCVVLACLTIMIYSINASITCIGQTPDLTGKKKKGLALLWTGQILSI